MHVFQQKVTVSYLVEIYNIPCCVSHDSTFPKIGMVVNKGLINGFNIDVYKCTGTR